MRKLIVLLIFISLNCFGQNSKKEIQNLLEKQTNDWNLGQIDAFMEGYWKSDSLMFIGKNGITRSWEATKNNYHKGYPDLETMGKLKFNILKIDFHSKTTAWVLGKWHLTRKEKGDIGGLFTLIIKKINGKWLIISDHTS